MKREISGIGNYLNLEMKTQLYGKSYKYLNVILLYYLDF